MIGRTLLVIDDEETWRDITSRFFTEKQYITHTAATCAEGIVLAEKHRPDYILLDYHLKDGKAPDVALHVKKSENLKKTFLLVISGDPTLRSAAYKLCKADHFIEKGDSCDLIHDVILNIEEREGISHGSIKKGDIILEADTCRVYLGPELVCTLPRENFRLFSLLVKKSPGVVGKMAIAEYMYGPEKAEDKCPDISVLVFRLRSALGPLASRIQSQRSFGWAYVPPDSAKE